MDPTRKRNSLSSFLQLTNLKMHFFETFIRTNLNKAKIKTFSLVTFYLLRNRVRNQLKVLRVPHFIINKIVDQVAQPWQRPNQLR